MGQTTSLLAGGCPGHGPWVWVHSSGKGIAAGDLVQEHVMHNDDKLMRA